jgi:hypothetical protein
VNGVILTLVTTLGASGLILSTPIPQNLRANQKGVRVGIIKGPALESSTTNTSAVIRWTTNTGGGTVVHHGVVHYGTEPNNLNHTAKSPNSRTCTLVPGMERICRSPPSSRASPLVQNNQPAAVLNDVRQLAQHEIAIHPLQGLDQCHQMEPAKIRQGIFDARAQPTNLPTCPCGGQSPSRLVGCPGSGSASVPRRLRSFCVQRIVSTGEI